MDSPTLSEGTGWFHVSFMKADQLEGHSDLSQALRVTSPQLLLPSSDSLDNKIVGWDKNRALKCRLQLEF